MFCPNCGQERISTETSFCSRCGFLLTGTADLLRTGGIIPQLPAQPSFRTPSPRNRGLKQGLFIFLLTFLIVPLIAIISVAIGIRPPWGVPIAAIILTMGGLLRMAYALMFESPVGGGATSEESRTAWARNLLNRPVSQALPPQQTYPVNSYVSPATGNWRDTNDLELISVTEGTTKLLEHDEIPQ